MKILIITHLLVLALNLHASQRAVTEEGQVVILNENGTWTTEGESSAVVAIDPKLWSFSKADD